MLAYLIGSMLSLDVPREQALLEAPTRLEALRLLHGYLANELRVLELRQKIASQAQTEMSKEQREYMLRQQLRAIQDELGEQTPESQEAEELRQPLRGGRPARRGAQGSRARPGPARAAAARRPRLPDHPDLSRAGPRAPLAAGARTTSWTWNAPSMVLDEDHYDLEKIKERILEHLAVLKLNPGAKAPILCFVGPPGRGQDLAGAVDRPRPGSQVRADEPGRPARRGASSAATAVPISAPCPAGSSRPSAAPG